MRKAQLPIDSIAISRPLLDHYLLDENGFDGKIQKIAPDISVLISNLINDLHASDDATKDRVSKARASSRL